MTKNYTRKEDGGWTPRSEETRRLGLQFKHHRERNNISLDRLGKEMGRTVLTIRRHEAGVTMLRTDDLIRAAKVMGIRPGLLLRTMKEQPK